MYLYSEQASLFSQIKESSGILMEKGRLKKGLMLELGLIMTLKLAWCIKICKNIEGQYLNWLLNTAAKCKFIVCIRPKSKEERGAKCSFPSLQNLFKFLHIHVFFKIWAVLEVGQVHLHLKHASLTCNPAFIKYLLSTSWV